MECTVWLLTLRPNLLNKICSYEPDKHSILWINIMDIVQWTLQHMPVPLLPTWTNIFEGFDTSAGVDYWDFKEKRLEAPIYSQIFTTHLCLTMDVSEDIVQ